MVFSSVLFLCLFMPVVFGIYYICPARFKNVFLLIVSLVFYAWGETRYIVIMLFSIVFNYITGCVIGFCKNRNKVKTGKFILFISIMGNLSIFGFFKYTDFIINSINEICNLHIRLLGIALPIGISFYTFQTMSYTIDVYMGKAEVQKNILDFGMYVCLFPQLIAGPIVRYGQISGQIKNRKIKSEDVVNGLWQFIIGLGKKVILANQIGELWDSISSASQLSVAGSWLGAIAYTFQIYFDFSGYSDMAIGMGKMLGFSFPQNFNYPYISKSITEFWRRWHISLGQWFREYVYIPLGGNKKGIERQVFNLLIVWILTGLWHGAGWNFIIWGIYFYVILIVEKIMLLDKLKKMPAVFGHIYAFVFITIGWVIFACEDFGKLIIYLKSLIGIGVPLINNTDIYNLYTHIPIIIILIVGSTMLPSRIAGSIKKFMTSGSGAVGWLGNHIFFWCGGLFYIAILIISIALIISGTYNPFLYFRF